MTDEILWEMYEKWTNSEKYKEESPLENEEYEERTKKVKDVVGENKYRKIIDDIIYLASETEIAGFYTGIRYGVILMSGILGKEMPSMPNTQEFPREVAVAKGGAA